MSEKFDQIKYIDEYNKQNYDKVQFRVPKGQKDRIKAAADSAGKSLNAFLNEAIETAILAQESNQCDTSI